MTLVTDAFVNEYEWVQWAALWLFLATLGLLAIGMALTRIPKVDVVGLVMILLAFPIGFAFFFSLIFGSLTAGTDTASLEKDITELGFVDVNYLASDNQFTALQDGKPVACSLFEVSETEYEVVCTERVR